MNPTTESPVLPQEGPAHSLDVQDAASKVPVAAKVGAKFDLSESRRVIGWSGIASAWKIGGGGMGTGGLSGC